MTRWVCIALLFSVKCTQNWVKYHIYGLQSRSENSIWTKSNKLYLVAAVGKCFRCQFASMMNVRGTDPRTQTRIRVHLQFVSTINIQFQNRRKFHDHSNQHHTSVHSNFRTKFTSSAFCYLLHFANVLWRRRRGAQSMHSKSVPSAVCHHWLMCIYKTKTLYKAKARQLNWRSKHENLIFCCRWLVRWWLNKQNSED